MNAAPAWRWCLAAGLVAFLCSWGFGRIPDLQACGETGGMGPILAFEFARTPAEVARLFGAEPCRSTLIGAQRVGLWLDALGFIPAYTAFLGFAAWATGRQFRRVLIGILVTAALLDQIEGVLLWRTLVALPGDQATLTALGWAVHGKFLLLALGTLGIALSLITTGWRAIPIAFALVIGTGAEVALANLFGGPSPRMMTGFTIAWVALLACAAIGAVWPRLLAPPASSASAPQRLSASASS